MQLEKIICPACDKEFTPLIKRKVFCYDEKCILERKKIYNKLFKEHNNRLNKKKQQQIRNANKKPAPQTNKVHPIQLQNMTPSQVEKFIRERRIL